MGDYGNLTVILPTLNEGANIASLLDFLIAGYPGIHVLVVDDASTDSTARTVKSKAGKNLKLIERRGKRGLTASIIDGIKAAQTPFVIVMDSDFQHPPEKIPEIYKLLRDGSDLAIACRKEVKGWPAHRRLISWGASFLADARLSICGCPKVSDILSGYFGAKREWALKSIASNTKRFEPQGYKFLFDLLKGVKPGSVKISEAGYVFGGRKAGNSKIGPGHMLRFLHSLFI
ncbi:MAG: glycosyltransferase [Candidatus ainarchaeum sp.]|nr:glycosyltransferase [Candidatus ainarchaeum sp.]